MTVHPIPPAPRDPSTERGSTRSVLGILLVMPMLVATVVSIGWPSIDTLVRATTVTDGFMGDRIGPADWATVLVEAGRLARAGLGQTVPAVVAGALVAVPMAQAIAAGAVVARIAVAALVTLPMPLAAATWWAIGPGEIGPAAAVGVATAALLPTVAGVAAIVLVPVVRAGLRVVPTLLAIVAVGAAVPAVALQTSITSVFASGPASTLPSASFELGFQRFALADAAALDLLVLVALGALGLAAVALLALLRPAIVIAPASGGRPLAATIGALVACAVAVGALGMPVLLALGGTGAGSMLDALAPAAIGTWVQALLGAAVATALAVAAAVGIGWLAPLGRGSLWLLVPFAPALLVTATPLATSAYLERIALGVGALPLVPTIVVSVPLLVGLTMLCSGMRRAGRLRVGTLSCAALMGFAMLAATSAQALQPARTLAAAPGESSIVLQLAALSAFTSSGAAVGIAAVATTLPVGLLLATAVVLGLGALRGATIVVGDEPLPVAPGGDATQGGPVFVRGASAHGASWQGAQVPPPVPGAQEPPRWAPPPPPPQQWR